MPRPVMAYGFLTTASSQRRTILRATSRSTVLLTVPRLVPNGDPYDSSQRKNRDSEADSL